MKYGVVILNYNTANDTIIAVKSVISNSNCENFKIVVVDNCSTKNDEKSKLVNGISVYDCCDIIYLDKNQGYSYGNNQGMKYLLSKYTIDNFVIMNPDVEIIEFGTIDRLINALEERDKSYIGVQPIVWTPSKGENKKNQTSIRRVMSYSDYVVEHFFLLKRIFRRKTAKMIYENEKPYITPLDFEVPSGAFFIIRADAFKNIGFFDERTFLYNEEIILGYKIKYDQKKFLFIPNLYVRHEGGKSIGSNHKRIKWYGIKFEMQSADIYLREYLKCNELQILLVKSLMILDFSIKKISYIFR